MGLGLQCPSRRVCEGGHPQAPGWCDRHQPHACVTPDAAPRCGCKQKKSVKCGRRRVSLMVGTRHPPLIDQAAQRRVWLGLGGDEGPLSAARLRRSGPGARGKRPDPSPPLLQPASTPGRRWRSDGPRLTRRHRACGARRASRCALTTLGPGGSSCHCLPENDAFLHGLESGGRGACGCVAEGGSLCVRGDVMLGAASCPWATASAVTGLAGPSSFNGPQSCGQHSEPDPAGSPFTMRRRRGRGGAL